LKAYLSTYKEEVMAKKKTYSLRFDVDEDQINEFKKALKQKGRTTYWVGETVVKYLFEKVKDENYDFEEFKIANKES
jgi:hypothetical protein